MADIILFALLSARRQDEITRLKWADLDREKGIAWLDDVKHPRKKIGNRRAFRLLSEAWEIIDRQPIVWRQDADGTRNPDPRVFPYKTQSIGANFTRACRLRGLIDLHFHDLRPEATSRIFERGYDIPEVAQFTLHESWTTLKRYTHLRSEQVPPRPPPIHLPLLPREIHPRIPRRAASKPESLSREEATPVQQTQFSISSTIMPVTNSPLRYPGGKTQLSPFVVDLLRANDLHGGVYAEPFAGGAGVAWRLLLNGDVTEVWLNDIDPVLFAFWTTVVENPDPLCERILRTKVTMWQWKKQRIALHDVDSSTLDLAYAALFLNRTNRSGILKAGVIGGKKQDGNYKLDCRFNKEELIQKIQRIHSYKKAVRVTQLDAERCLRKWDKSFPARGLVNIDPPYFVQGQELYLSFYAPKDHERLAKLVRGLRVPWMLTYDDVPEIESLYSGLPIYRKGLIYYAQVKRRASELLVLSPALVAPSGLSDRIAA